MILKDLNKIGIDSQNSFLKYNKEEIKLSSEFKSLFTKIIQKDSKESVTFSEFTTIVKTSKGLTITFPNQWFYIASFFVDFLNSLKLYKNHYQNILKDVSNIKDVLNNIKKTSELPQEIKNEINNYFNSEEDIEKFKRFLSDYNWWFGSKTIDRADYFVSPILNLAQVVNVSQSYIAHLTHLFSTNPKLLEYLHQSEVKKETPTKVSDLINEIVIKSNSIRDFAFKTFDHFFSNDWSTILNESQIKDAKINETKYKILDHEWFNNLIGVFDNLQDKKSLTSSKTIRYFEKPIFNKDGIYYYFTTQWNANGEYNLSFRNLKNFIENRFPSYELIHEGKTFILSIIQDNKPIDTQTAFNIVNFYTICKDSGLNYNKQLITRYISSLVTKPFVLLSGLSGSGKTKLAQSFALWIAQDESQYCIVPVGADWTNREPLLGYVNALNGEEYILPENGALQLLIEANKEVNKNKPYFLILDEMNLSHVERYFADFLSVMESRDKLKLHNSKENKGIVSPDLDWPNNLFIVGTVNIDETTYMFSPKVLDRANVIEFRVNKSDISDFLNSPTDIDFKNLNNKGATMGESFIEIASNKVFPKIDTEKLNKKLVLFFEELKKTGAEFGYRTAIEIHRLYNQLTTLDSNMLENTKIDIAIMQKLLPKLHGSRRKLCPILEVLASFCVTENTDVEKEFLNNKENLVNSENENVLYPLSLEKITRMYKGAIDNGFASFAEA